MADLRKKTRDDFLLLIDLCKDPRRTFPIDSHESKMAIIWLKKLCNQPCRGIKEAQIRNTYFSLLVASLNMGCMIDPFLHPPKGKLRKVMDNGTPDTVLEQLSFWERTLKKAIQPTQCTGDNLTILTSPNQHHCCGKCVQYDHFSRHCHYSPEVSSKQWNKLKSTLSASMSKLTLSLDCTSEDKGDKDCSGCGKTSMVLYEPHVPGRIGIAISPTICEKIKEDTNKEPANPRVHSLYPICTCTCACCLKKKNDSMSPSTPKLPVAACACTKATQTTTSGKSTRSCRRTAIPVWISSNKAKSPSKRPSLTIPKRSSKFSKNSKSRKSALNSKSSFLSSKMCLSERECTICEDNKCPIVKLARKLRRKKSGCKCKTNECEKGLPDFLSPPVQIKNLYPENSIPIYYDNCIKNNCMNPNWCSKSNCCSGVLNSSANCGKNYNPKCSKISHCNKNMCYRF